MIHHLVGKAEDEGALAVGNILRGDVGELDAEGLDRP